MRDPTDILLIRPDHLGDLILSLPVAMALKDAFPGCRVSYLAASGPAGIRSLAHYVDNWIIDATNKGNRLSLYSLADLLKSQKFDTLIELKPSWRTATAACIAGVKYRIGTSRRFYSFFYNERINLHRRRSGFHQTDLDLAMLIPLNIKISGLQPRLDIDSPTAETVLKTLELMPKEYAVIHPGSAGSSPNWPLEYYRRLAGMLPDIGVSTVVVTGANDPIGQFENCVDLNGRTDIETLAAVLGGAAVFISGSTGPLHLADALSANCVAFFPMRDDLGPVRWGPRRNMENVLTPETVCRCRDLRQCQCLRQISPERALRKIEDVLNNARRLAGK